MISYDDRLNCKSARLCYYDLLDTKAEATVPEDIREHIASCRHCQADMSRLKTLLADTARTGESEQKRKDSVISTLLSLHFAWIDKPVTCKSAKAFLASLADPVLRITIPTPITVHIDKCRRCSDQLSTIKSSRYTHKQLCLLGRAMAEAPSEDVADCAVAEQPDSGIATCFTFREPSGRNVQTESNEMYADWPIDVQVLSRERLEDAETAGSSAPRQRALILNLKRHFRPAIAAAAVILIGLALFFTTPTVSAVDLDQIYRAVKRARNIHITNFDAGRTEPRQEQWVSRSLNIYMSKVGQELTLWDFRDGPKKIQSSHGAAPEAVSFTETDVAAIRRKMDSTLGIVPFDSMSDAPPDAKWNQVTDVVLEAGTQDCEVYDLTWTQRTGLGRAIPKRWRVLVDPKTDLPRKIQFSAKRSTDGEYVPESEYEVEHLSDEDIKTVIEEASL